MAEIRGKHVLIGFVLAFSVIIGANLTLAVSAVKTFPGLEVENTYVASQSFDRDRDAQLALGWDVHARLDGDQLRLVITRDGKPVNPRIETAIFGRATSVAWDQEPDLVFDGSALVARVDAGPGNWNLRLRARAADGTLFQQRVVVEVEK